MFRGDTVVDLVVLCGEKPTKSLLERMALNLPAQLAAAAPDEPAPYLVSRDIQAASLLVSTPESRPTRQEAAQYLHICFTVPNDRVADPNPDPVGSGPFW